MSLRVRVAMLWRNLLRREQLERDLDDELRAALDILIDENIRAGMSPEVARRSALRTFGSVQSVKAHVRAVRAGAFVDQLLQDTRHAARLLARHPAFTLTAALSLAVGIGATTSIFTVANGLLFRAAVGVTEPDRLVDIVRLERGGEPSGGQISYPDYLDIRDRTSTVQGVFAYQLLLSASSLRVGDNSERVFPTAVSTNYFQLLGVSAAAGRLFGPDDSDKPGATPAVVLSHRFWERRFSKDPSVVGQTVRINAYPLTIIGVAAESFRGTFVTAPDLWLPVGMITVVAPEDGAQVLTNRQVRWLSLGARLRPGVTQEQASAELAVVGAALEHTYASERHNGPPRSSIARESQGSDNVSFVWSAETSAPVPRGLRGLLAVFLILLMALVSVVLVITCTNVASVLLARATSRRREIAVRVSAGASRGRLIRQLLTETSLLFLLGGGFGLAMARLMTALLLSLLPASPIPIALSVPLDYRVVAFALGLSLLAALLAGLTPALHASKSDVVSALKDDVHGAPERLWLRHSFVVVQVAFSLVLVLTAGLLVEALTNIRSVDRGYGFDSTGVDAVAIDLSGAGYAPTAGAQFARELIARTRSLPGVEHATLASGTPAPGVSMNLGGIAVPGVTPPAGQQLFYPSWTIIESGYFDTLRMRILEGRDFRDADSEGAEPVVILGRQAAELFWPNQSGLGQLLLAHMSPPDVGDVPPVQMRVIGVVEDAWSEGPLEMYVPLRQRAWSGLTILARRSDERSVAGDLRALVITMNRSVPVLFAQSLDSLQQNGPMQIQLRVAATVGGSMGLVGLLLAAMGIYGVTAYVVAQRTREIGIRLALGATRSAVVGMVLRQGMALVLVGLVIGLALSAGVARVLTTQGLGPGVYVPPPDAATVVVALCAFVAIGLAACFGPVRRAAQMQAMDALRYE